MQSDLNGAIALLQAVTTMLQSATRKLDSCDFEDDILAIDAIEYQLSDVIQSLYNQKPERYRAIGLQRVLRAFHDGALSHDDLVQRLRENHNLPDYEAERVAMDDHIAEIVNNAKREGLLTDEKRPQLTEAGKNSALDDIPF